MPVTAPLSLASVTLLLLALPACGDPGTTTSGTTSEDPSATAEPTIASTTSSTTTSSPTTSGTSTSGTTTDATTSSPTTTDATTSTTTGGVEELPPTDSAALLEQWLMDGAYKSWPVESQIHPSDGPHGGNVRTYVNTALEQSLAGAAAMHPQGAATVKELYGDGDDAITGYAVMVKLAPDSAGGDGWYWYERLGGTVFADGAGVGLCTACHVGGADYILTPFPLQ